MKQTRKRRILIVDDSEMNREILTGILEDEYDIVEAEDGKKAIAIMEEGLYSFSIVLRILPCRSWMDSACCR